MAEQKDEQELIMRTETRKFTYSNEVTFEFDMDVSNPSTALVEIADFLVLMAKAAEDLRVLQKTFASQIEKPVKTETEKSNAGSSVGKKQVAKDNK